MIAWAACIPVRYVRPNLFTFNASIFLKSQWHQFPKPWKTLLILSNLHSTWPKRATFLWKTFFSFVLRVKNFHWFSRYSCLGNCLVWKVNLHEKNVHASQLNANGSIGFHRTINRRRRSINGDSIQLKNIWEKETCVLSSKLFPRSGEHYVVYKLKQDSYH